MPVGVGLGSLANWRLSCCFNWHQEDHWDPKHHLGGPERCFCTMEPWQWCEGREGAKESAGSENRQGKLPSILAQAGKGLKILEAFLGPTGLRGVSQAQLGEHPEASPTCTG